jgi:hypothetical protein
MRKLILLGLVSTAFLYAPAALPCGMPFGQDTYFQPDQFIVVRHKNGVEDYIFRPQFCGKAAQFGLILPVPATLTQNPSLAKVALLDQLKEYTKPQIEAKTECYGRQGGADGGHTGAAGSGTGVNVINKGQVGFLDWVLVQAATQDAFTTWLTQNGFPYPSDAATQAVFGSYVTKSWYFVAFKVSADSSAPPAGLQLCGDLGPISLSFAATAPVIPARITGAGTSYHYGWGVYTISDKLFESTQQGVQTTTKFGGTFGAGDFTTFPEIASLASAGDRLGKLVIDFWGGQINDDINLIPATSQADFRATDYQITYVNCTDAGTGGSSAGGSGGSSASPPSDDSGGCAVRSNPSRWASVLLGLSAAALALLVRRRR